MNKILTGDCVKAMRALRKNGAKKFDLAIVDPPFNIGLKYHNKVDDRRPKTQYISWTLDWAVALHECLKPTASAYVFIGDEMAAEVKQSLEHVGFHFRSWIIWHYTFGVNCQGKWGRGHTHILYFTMNPTRFCWNDSEIRVPSDRQLLYNDKRADPRGRVPSDVWTYSRVCGTFKERAKGGPPCQTPEALLERIIKASSRPGDAIIDPMAGSGAALAVARRLGRSWLGIEISFAYAAAARKRVNASRPGRAAAGASPPNSPAK